MEPRRARRAATNNRTRKVVAIVAAAAVAGVGASLSLAAWNDTEWLFAGAGTEPGISTSSFELEQLALPASGAAPGSTAWADYETNPGNGVTFTLSDLTPGDSTYALVAVRSSADSLGGTATLAAATAAAGVTVADAGGHLWNATDVRVSTWSGADLAATKACNAATFGNVANTTIATGDLGASGGTAAQTYAADSGNVNFYCFELTFTVPGVLPSGITTVDDYMGRSIAPAWKFDAASA
ncbi:acyl-CoA dehydrogenase [Microbacterium sp. LWH10-1.2]|jgi:hypothetical protein|uniref:acyl-CoA dehydrogenase n=1 Tax=Microbacterium sp. LWH10-1.2 TaxID=3135255 RepID=UPI0031388B94